MSIPRGTLFGVRHRPLLETRASVGVVAHGSSAYDEIIKRVQATQPAWVRADYERRMASERKREEQTDG